MSDMSIVRDEPPELQDLAEVLPMSFRSDEGERKYQRAKMLGITVPLADEPTLVEFRHWRIIDNGFPGDARFKTSHMLLSKRVAANYEDLTPEERDELHDLAFGTAGYCADHYDLVGINSPWKRSVHNHYHIHLYCFVDGRGDVKL